MNKDIINIRTTPSTNDLAKELLQNKGVKSPITIFDCYEQTKGRGQKGNAWESQKGCNITASILIQPTFLKPDEQFFLSMMVSLTVSEFLKQYVPSVLVKWPNDIYVGDKKICGILIENSIDTEKIQHSIIGIGLNINQKIFSKNLPNPTSLSIETSKKYNLDKLKHDFFSFFEAKYYNFLNGNLQYIKDEYLSYLYRKDMWAQYKTQETIFEGRIKTVDHHGRLIVETKQGIMKPFVFKEISYV